MTDDADVESEEEPPKKSKLPMILGLVLAIAGGGGGFYAVSSGMLLGSGDEHAQEDAHAADEHGEEMTAEPVAFVPLDPLMIGLPTDRGQVTLRFRAHLEVAPEHLEEVTNITPRIVDVLNSYLRAVDLAELQDPSILARLRGQMLRRVQVVAGTDQVHDLLIMEFVLN